MQYHIGIDVGTTNIKSAAYTMDGRRIAYHAEPTPIVNPQPGFSEFEPESVWRCVCLCLRAVTDAVGSAHIRTLGISSMAEAGVPLDVAGRPLYNFIAWYDQRSQPQSDALESILGRHTLYKTTGQPPSGKYGLTKLMWLTQNRPSEMGALAHWLSMEDYILYRLTSEFATDYSVAARTMAFDVSRLSWSSEILDAAGVSESVFPAPLPGGTRVGQVTRVAAMETGLSPDTIVSTGGHDHACAAIGVNILEPGVVLDSMGTAEVLMSALESLALPEQGDVSYHSVYPHCGKRLYRVLSSSQTCGACIEWYLRAFGRELIQEANQRGVSRYDALLARMAEGGARHPGLLFFPFLRGSVEQPGMRGAFLGITDEHTDGDFIAAIIDGLCFEQRYQLERYLQVPTQNVSALRVVGGLSKSPHIMNRKSAIQGCPVETPEDTEAACAGAAALGAIGAGDLSFDQLHAFYRPGLRYSASSEGDAQYSRYLSLREGIKRLY